MSTASNDNGRAFEYACITALKAEIEKLRGTNSAIIEDNSSLKAAKHAWDNTDSEYHKTILKAAEAMACKIPELEPMISETDDEVILLRLQKDEAGENGDVRDIVIVRGTSGWEIGLSVKHNHFAVKHSRLSTSIDFGEKWYGIPCSKKYWDAVMPIFEFLKEKKSKVTKWSELEDKENDVYVPLLRAFMDEILRTSEMDSSFPRRMVEYLLGEYDFYKVISVDSKCETDIQPFNLHGTLNKPSKSRKATLKIPVIQLPDELVAVKMKKDSTNTAELYLNNGWQFSFRIHNASTYVEPSLKFDIKFSGMPTDIILICCKW